MTGPQTEAILPAQRHLAAADAYPPTRLPTILNYWSSVVIAGAAGCPRKVRAPESRLPGNAWAPKGDDKGHRKQTAPRSRKASKGKGETVG